MNIDWKKKLSSRKFWAAAAALVATVCVLFGIDDISAEKVCAMISACGVLAVYIFTEGYVDAKGNTESKDKANE